MQFTELVIYARSEGVIPDWRANDLYKRRNLGRAHCGWGVFKPPPNKCRRRGNRKEWISLEGHQRIYRGGVKNGVVLVSCEEERAPPPVVKRQPDRAAEREARIVFFERQ